ncbi:1-acyl-sn-glycerol-3-phosphate acyltransferase [Pontibacter sp. G13]|uniref:1-acyl-sn-glycerol-3-phosphate acyltransferase n=1 Tax=Pontibacter sp. G13 TaxID=3074898 RepID=UPI00288B90E6|nr:1-acyl-sn-glycerol-3-phosphate acyltransferase [Pontibacter sp. G13]WNJ21049.1 1-acyl-sn-glycerol-3-phosphate acyltransferase [Pontibacter sp. G13]
MESIQHYINEGILYEPVIPSIQDWPIAQLAQNKSTFLEEVVQDTQLRLTKGMADPTAGIQEMIERTMYLERIRMVEDPWKVDPKDEGKYWKDIRKQLIGNEQSGIPGPEMLANNEAMLGSIISRYANEIAGTFKPGSYHFAKRFLPFFFSTLLNASAGKTFKSVVKHNIGLQERVHLLGEVDMLRKLATKGTIVLVPTHFSNVDSILVGWSLHALGLPAFIYGAGLNLYNTKILAYFMNRLGAYTVDRRKKNAIYRETLNAYSTLAIMEGTHSLFFPGGTRSRSGMIEKKLKLGLLGTAVEAQRRNFIGPPRSGSEKIFVVPMVMSYHFVLEANSLIKQYLRRTGQEQFYVADDESASYQKFLQFVWTTFSSSSDIAMSFGKPMDIFGHFVDEHGMSYDHFGRPVDVREYFMTRGEIKEDPQRDFEFTRMLAEQIVDRYHVENRVFSSHLVAFVAFNILKKRFGEFDLYAILRLPEEERNISLEEFHAVVERVLGELRKMADAGKVHLAAHMQNDTMGIINHGIKNLGIYHAKRPLTFVKKKEMLTSESMHLLYYYHNRMVGYELERYI